MPHIDRAQHLAQRLDQALDQIADLLPLLAGMLPHRDTGGPRTGTFGHSTPDGSEPWNSAVADVFTSIWFGIPKVVNYMRTSLGLRRLDFAPGGTAGCDVIRQLASSVPEVVLDAAMRDCERWVIRARQLPAIDESEPWTSLPTLPQYGHPPLCPYCGTTALRMRKRAAEVACFMPDCTDGDGRPTRARMEPGRMTGEARLVFADGMFLTFERAER